MIYGYRNTNGTIEYLGTSDTQERLVKALQLANIDITGIEYTDTEPVNINGKYFLSADEAEAQAEQAIVDNANAINELNAEYNEAKNQLLSYLGEALLMGADDIVEELKAEYAGIQEQYDNELSQLEG